MSVVFRPGDHNVTFIRVPLQWEPEELDDFQLVTVDTGLGITSGMIDSDVGKGYANIDLAYGLYGPFENNKESRVLLSFSLRAVGKPGAQSVIVFGSDVQALSMSDWDATSDNILGFRPGGPTAVVHIQ